MTVDPSYPSSFPSSLPAASFAVPPFVVHVRDIVASTNDEAKSLAEAGAPDGSVIWAREQRAGRGRLARQWLSPPGNLYMSALLRPAVPPPRTTELGFVASLAMAETVEAFQPHPARLKWPNDVLVNGQKISGILLEGQFKGMEVAWVIAGIGINVASTPDNPAYPATSLAACGGGEIEVRRVLERLLTRLGAGLEVWREQGFPAVREAWIARAARLGETVTVRIGGEPLSGRFAGIGQDGALLMETAAGARRITTGEVAFGPA